MSIRRPSSSEQNAVIAGIRIEIAARRLDHNLTEKSCLRELMQRVVDRRERHADPGGGGFGVQRLSADVTVALPEQNPASAIRYWVGLRRAAFSRLISGSCRSRASFRSQNSSGTRVLRR